MSQPVGPALPEKKPCIFYKLIVSSILQDKKLRIPHKFVKKYGDELSSIVTLATPSGRFWLVELMKDRRRMWFDSGWNVFLEYYSICVGYFLVFRYEGNSHFNVHVYNLAASEINYLSNGLNNSEEPSPDEHVKNIEDGDLAQIMGSCPKCSSSYFLTDKDSDECLDHDRKKHKNTTCGADLKNLHQKNDMRDLQATFQLTQGKGTQLNVVELTSPADEGGPYFLNETHRITRKIKQETEPNEQEEELPAVNTPRNIARRWRDVTTEEKQSAFHAAATFKPDNPFCRIILRPSYVYKGILLHIPRWFARKHLNGVNGTITLQVSEGKKWPVRCIHVDGHLKFCKGWAEFVLDNNLDEGDVCVFELISTQEIVLKVTIFRVLEDAGPVNKL
ncbi:B3 domain-containing transcription factor VRN1-like isoform X3 [Herrania umbratica]|uniref:B3 domain-containing transcription factor VRN1-like isoform X3 n=1 Tax=Herrania umbratica TaxID=108875 RepID=A0A6J1AK53_9ROSI|nr:B3 domain-containing transcription factor VRN1-like isoform X3 [Herrania umbratica]